MAKKKIEIALEIDGKQGKMTINDADKLVKGLAVHTKSVSSELSKMGNIMTGINSAFALTRTAWDTIDNALQKYTDFEAGLANVNTILNVSQKEMKEYGDQLLAIGESAGMSAKEMTDAFYQAASAGVNTANMMSFLDVSSKAAVAGLTDTETAVDGLTTVLNAFHLEANKAGRVADIMFQTVKLGKTTFGELAQSLADVAPLAASSGIKFEEISAAIATLTKQGVKTPQAITQIRSAIIAANDVLGDGWAKTMSFQEGMKKIAEQAGGSQKKLKGLVGRIEGVNGVLGLTGKNAKTAAEDLKAMENAAGSMTKAFSIQADTVAFKIKKMKSSWEKLQITLIDSFGPAISYIMDSISNALDEITGKTDKLRKKMETETRKKYVIGWYITFKGYSKKELTHEAELIKKELAKITSTPTYGATIYSLLGIKTDEYKADVRKIKQLEDQLKAIQHLIDGTVPKYQHAADEANRAADKIKNLASKSAATGSIQKPTIPLIGVPIDEYQQIFDEADSIEEEFLNKELERQKELDTARNQYFEAEKSRREQDDYAKQVYTASSIELNTMLVSEQQKSVNLLTRMQTSFTREQFRALQKERKLTQEKISMIQAEKNARLKSIQSSVQSGWDAYDSQKSVIKNLGNLAHKIIGQEIAKGVAAAVSNAIVGLPFPIDLIAAPLAGIAAAALFNSIIPSFGVGGMIEGPAHSHGGVLINAEGGEYIINAQASRDNVALLEAINNGGNVIVSDTAGAKMIVAKLEDVAQRLESVERKISISQFDEVYLAYNQEKTAAGI